MQRLFALVLAGAVAAIGCRGDTADATAPARATGTATATATAAPRGTPALFDSVPADTAFVLALREPLAPAARDRLAYDALPFAARLAAVARARLAEAGFTDPRDRLGAALAAELPAALDGGTRAIVHELRGAVVVELEVGDERALRDAALRAATAARVTAAAPSRWIAVGGDGAIAVIRRGRHLAIAVGAEARVRAIAPVLAGDVPLGGPALDGATLPALGGFVDLRGLPRLFDTTGDPCREAGVALLDLIAAVLPRITLEAHVTDARVELVVHAALAPSTATAIAAPRAVTPGLPAAFPGHPLFAGSFLAPDAVPDDAIPRAWSGPLGRLAMSCGGGLAAGSVAMPTAVRGGAIAFYGDDHRAAIPTGLQAYLAIVTRAPEPLLATLRKGVRSGSLSFFFDDLQIDRRGDTIMISSGKVGTARAREALAATTAPPLVHVVTDVTRLAAPPPDPPDSITTVGNGVADEADVGAMLARVIATIDLTIDHDLVITAALAPRATPAASSALDPRRHAIAECDRLLDAIWASDRRSLARLGVTSQGDYEQRFHDGTGTFTFACVALPDADRACLLGAIDPLDLEGPCQATSALPAPSLWELDTSPMARRVAASAPSFADLAGTWKSGDETWTIAASGASTSTEANGRPVHQMLTMGSDGGLLVREPDGGTTIVGTPVRVGHDELDVATTGAYPIPDRDHFVARHDERDGGDAWIIREPGGCWTIDDRGRHRTATCEFRVDNGQTFFDVDAAVFRVRGDHLIDTQAIVRTYARVP